MPKNKRDSSDSDTSDSGPDDKGPLKQQPASKKSKPSGSGLRVDDAKEPSWQLDKMRMVKVREFKGKTYIDIREYYEKDGETLPGKKGISLNASQWQKLKQVIPEVDEALKDM